ncbi:family 20 glycosylhydrolase [Flavivirga spongiicola]|uniref:beta-N-acetylhexosaminidase n=1 Tax=Flavivirga spongiicola TaxID=421621 RepID=A0ABU7XNY0_9FLAO|nr:family 20 glycosylhydrolase [Flavivirga sp. MEBiC05379]MDO5977484.1 family 20 glycosylhydrolase [Flavivirga sp. MEBiC05379]
MKVFNKITILLIIALSSCTKEKVFSESDIQIIPKPTELILNKGTFQFTKDTKFIIANETQKELLNIFISKFSTVAGWNLEVLETTPQKNYVQFLIDERLENESYNLEVNTDKISIVANGNSGFIYALESIRQLLPIDIERSEMVSDVAWIIPNLKIKDNPRFKWRGLMLDLSRHFFDKEYIKKVIDGLAMHKMNVLHLHLVDDQGWRIEIKKYPKLTTIGGWRVDQEDKHWNAREAVKANEKGTYGGFLTQADLKELVAYAQLKNVEIVPEIEMPAHVSSAIAAYPELSCFETPIGVPSGGVWPITDIYCAGKENTFQFLENVLLEVMDIFPSKYIHIGGDEATKTNWKTCPHCKKRMKKEGLHEVEELQSYFVKRMEKFINSKGKKLIGWDEILEGGLAPDATVMSWRGIKGGLEAAKQGHDVIMTPNSHCYFDHYQGPQNEEPLAIGGYLPLSKVYQFDPVVDTMSAEEASHVLGGQANLWAEYIPTPEHSQYMIFPRLAALAETVWSPKALRNWDDFSKRIATMFKRYDYLGINYAKSTNLVTANTTVNLEDKSVSLSLQNEFTNTDIRYVLGSSNIDENPIKYNNPIELNKTTIVKASLFKAGKPIGKVFIDTIKFHKGVAHKTEYLTLYSNSYQGAGAYNMVNSLRGTKNFHDGQWQAWLGEDMEIVIDLENKEEISEVILGSMENQGPDIYFPTSVSVFVSNDGNSYKEAGKIERPFQHNSKAELRDFRIKFKEQAVRFVKVRATCLEKSPKGGRAWLFVDEILIN